MAVAPAPTELPAVQVAQLPTAATSARWLVRSLWTRQGVGFIGGVPKVCKSWLGLDLAVSVASATACLERFPVDDPGPALVYLAEDALPAVRERIAGLCLHRGLDLAALPLHVITAPQVRLDTLGDQQRLVATLLRLRPRLLLLDPLVRLHSLDENSSTEISTLLGFLRELQRTHEVAIILVHHLGKRSCAQLGQALRGTGDLHAWADDNAFLVRQDERLELTLEHRSAPAGEPLTLRLVVTPDGRGAHLEVVDPEGAASPEAAPSPAPFPEQILAALRGSQEPLPRGILRERLRVNNARLGEALEALEAQGQVRRTATGWTLPRPSQPSLFEPTRPT